MARKKKIVKEIEPESVLKRIHLYLDLSHEEIAQLKTRAVMQNKSAKQYVTDLLKAELQK